MKLEPEFGLISQRTSMSIKDVAPVNKIIALSGDEHPRAFGEDTAVVL
jgi:hypothetical protein